MHLIGWCKYMSTGMRIDTRIDKRNDMRNDMRTGTESRPAKKNPQSRIRATSADDGPHILPPQLCVYTCVHADMRAQTCACRHARRHVRRRVCRHARGNACGHGFPDMRAEEKRGHVRRLRHGCCVDAGRADSFFVPPASRSPPTASAEGRPEGSERRLPSTALFDAAAGTRRSRR